MAGYTILVSGLAPETTESKLQDFFSFCGKTLSVNKTEKSASIVFERESAAKTALMLNGGTLDGAHLEVTSPSTGFSPTSASSSTTAAPVAPTSALPASANDATPIGAALNEEGEVRQEDKPRAAIVAEYIAYGYTLSDSIIDQFLEMDRKQGISSRFIDFMHRLDKEVGTRVVGPDATASHVVAAPIAQYYSKAQDYDKQKGISDRFVKSYSKAANTTVGQKMLKFYTDVSKEVLDVHEEAKRLSSEKKANLDRIAAEKATATPAATSGAGEAEAPASAPASAVVGV